MLCQFLPHSKVTQSFTHTHTHTHTHSFSLFLHYLPSCSILRDCIQFLVLSVYIYTYIHTHTCTYYIYILEPHCLSILNVIAWYAATLLKLLIPTWVFFGGGVKSWDFLYTESYHLQIAMVLLLPSQFGCLFFPLSCLMARARISNTVWNKSDEIKWA